MTSDAFDIELEHRLRLLEDTEDMSLPDLPLVDIVVCIAGLVSSAALLLWWSL